VAAGSLGRYRELRDFHRTPEPSGDGDGAAPVDLPRFVIQQHDATRLHWDLRLEHDGVLPSWALPRGVPWSPDDNHLAVHTEDHPLEYLTFSGEIPEGNYGAGAMFIWDTGTYEVHEWTDRKVVITLHGERATGRYALFQTRGRDWIIHRMDPPADPERRPVPADLRPMTARPGRLPRDQDRFAFEVRWSGQRVLAVSSGGVVELRDPDGVDVAERYPEVRRVGRAIGSVEVVLDGVVTDPRGGDAVARRADVRSDSGWRRLAERAPVTLVAFDLIWLDGHPVTDLPYENRRRLLEELDLAGPAWQVPAAHVGDGTALLQAARAKGLWGLVAKRLDSPYRPGRRSDDWREIRA
jgi:bifunctional non-homologous end joining protein LigD